MAPVVPALLRRYGLRPWELHLLSGAELDALMSDLKASVGGG